MTTTWILDEEKLRSMLEQVRDGEDPDVVIVEHFVNAKHWDDPDG